MKTKAEWAADVNTITRESYLAGIKAIQLDAMKEGARRAAGICVQEDWVQTYQVCEIAILSAAENWTEKDL